MEREMPGLGTKSATNMSGLKRNAVKTARDGSRAAAASIILGISRTVRKECRAQASGIPDLSRHQGQSAEGALVYEFLPELSRRLLEGSGATMLRTAGEMEIPSLKHFTDQDLRLAIGDTLRHSRFAAIASRLRLHQSGTAVATELLASSFQEGNVIEIVTSRLAAPLPRNHPAALRDYLEIDRYREAAAAAKPCESPIYGSGNTAVREPAAEPAPGF